MITSRDVAETAGVSVSTVSLVLSGRWQEKRISVSAKDRVLEAAKKLKYQPNQLARGLKMGRTNTIVVATLDKLYHSYVHQRIEAIRIALQQNGCRMLLEVFGGIDEAERWMPQNTRSICDGIVLIGANPAELASLIKKHPKGMPLVVSGTSVSKTVNSVTYDRIEAVRLSVNHLAEQGCKRIAMIYDAVDGPVSKERVSGYKRALRMANIPFDQSLLIRSNVDKESGEQIAEKLLKAAIPPLGVFCYNNESAMQLVHALLKKGFRVPDDIAVVAHGDTRLNVLCDVPLTGISTDEDNIARAIMKILFEEIADPKRPPCQVVIPPFLVARASSLRRKTGG